MGLLDNLNDFTKASESIANIGASISKLVDEGAKAVATLTDKTAVTKTNKMPDDKTTDVAATIKNPNAALTFQSIGCSEKTMSIINLSLADGTIDEKERAMLMRRVQEENIDPQEFDFLLTKTLENYHQQAKNCIKDLSATFALAERMASKEEKADSKTLASSLPKVSGIISDPSAYAAIASAIADIVMQTIGNFIKAPSRLNTFKSEIIRLIEIPMYPEVLVDFFSYASSQINEEQQRNEGKGLFAEWSESLFGKDIDLIPIWQNKIDHVMTKAIVRFGNMPEVMTLLSKWRTTPLQRLMKLTDPCQIEDFAVPDNVSDYIEVLRYSFYVSQDPSKPLKEPYSKLYNRIYKEGTRQYINNSFAAEAIDSYRLRPLMELAANAHNPAALAVFETPGRLSDLLEVLAFLKTRNDLKKVHQRIYREGCEIFANDPHAIAKINEFKPRNILGF